MEPSADQKKASRIPKNRPKKTNVHTEIVLVISNAIKPIISRLREIFERSIILVLLNRSAMAPPMIIKISLGTLVATKTIPSDASRFNVCTIYQDCANIKKEMAKLENKPAIHMEVKCVFDQMLFTPLEISI